MEYPFILFVLVIILIIVIVIMSTGVQVRRKQKKLLISSFGKLPNDTEYELDSIKTYFCYKSKKDMGNRPVDDITWNDLDMTGS